MNRFVAFCITFMLTIMSAESLMACGTTLRTVLYMQTNYSPQYEEYEDEKGNRFVALTCTVSRENGVEISGTTDEIISYEIWDATGTVCIAYFTNEEEFVEYLFSLNGDFQLVFFFEDYTLTGEITVD